MNAPDLVRHTGLKAVRPLAAGVAALLLSMTAPAAAQSLLDRPPNLGGTWVGSPGVVYFNFMHRFQASPPPARKVENTPTFLLATGLPGGALVGARYATKSTLVSGFPNEWEFFTRYSPLLQSAGRPGDLSVAAGYNQATQSFDGQLTLARRVGPVRLLASARGFSNTFGESAARAALAGGATVRLTEFVALAGDYATLLDAASGEDAAWSAGVQIRLPTTPHTLSLHASNTSTTTLEGASIGTGATLWGFEFTVPITVSRYIGSGGPPAAPPAPDDADVVDDAADSGVVEVTMSNGLAYEAPTVRVRTGDTVRWINTTNLVHTVTADPERAMDPQNVRLPPGAEPFDSGDMNPGAEYTRTFEVPGRYIYFCVPHEAAGMVGTVVVESASRSTS